MNVYDWLRKLGIFRSGCESAVYHNAAERPLSLQQDDVFDTEKDVLCSADRRGEEESPEKGESQTAQPLGARK